MQSVRVALLDEQRVFRELLAALLGRSKDILVVGEAGGSCRAVAVCRETRPDLAILDLRLPRLNELELATCLRKQLPALRLIALTDLTDAYAIRRAVDAGVQGYVEKGQPLAVLLQAIRHVAAGKTFFTEIYRQRVREMAEEPFSFPKVLSAREQQILALIAEGRTSRAVAKQLGLSARTVESHRRNIMKKMEIKAMAGLVRFAVLQGFKFEECRAHDSGRCAGCAGG